MTRLEAMSRLPDEPRNIVRCFLDLAEDAQIEARRPFLAREWKRQEESTKSSAKRLLSIYFTDEELPEVYSVLEIN